MKRMDIILFGIIGIIMTMTFVFIANKFSGKTYQEINHNNYNEHNNDQ